MKIFHWLYSPPKHSIYILKQYSDVLVMIFITDRNMKENFARSPCINYKKTSIHREFNL